MYSINTLESYIVVDCFVNVLDLMNILVALIVLRLGHVRLVLGKRLPALSLDGLLLQLLLLLLPPLLILIELLLPPDQPLHEQVGGRPVAGVRGGDDRVHVHCVAGGLHAQA